MVKKKNKGDILSMGLIIIFAVILMGFSGYIVFDSSMAIIVTQDLKQNLEIKEGWYVEKVSWFTVEHIGEDWYNIYVRLRKYDEPWKWTNDKLYYNYKTKEVKSNFYYR